MNAVLEQASPLTPTLSPEGARETSGVSSLEFRVPGSDNPKPETQNSKVETTAAELVAFEEEVARLFQDGKIRYPIHLQGGLDYAEAMLKAFKPVQPQDWVCCGWRSHWQCLLKGVEREDVLKAIMEGRSMTMCFPERRIISSAIAGGILPIALGLAYGLKVAGSPATVHCWLGDMTARMGVALECRDYAAAQNLPVRWIVEDNGLSVCSPTKSVWPGPVPAFGERYYYSSAFPHAGVGKRVRF